MTRSVAVLGAGICGVSAALHLQAHGCDVVMIDRGPPGSETSGGNAGLIEGSVLEPHPFPPGLMTFARYALNRASELRYRPQSLPAMAWPLISYWRNSRPARLAPIARAFRGLVLVALESTARWPVRRAPRT